MSKSKLIFGSTAAKHWFPLHFREPNDLDIISKDHYWAGPFQTILDKNCHDQFVDPDFLYTIKMSHAAWNVHWLKTINDIILLKDLGCRLHKTLYNDLYKFWEGYHDPKKRISIQGHPKDFFKPNVKRVYDHDKLHHDFAFYNRPLHESIRPNLNDVK